jgi:hypothetical protein
MKKFCLVLIILVLASSISIAQGKKAAHFKSLQDFLPTKQVKGYKLLNPSGNEQTTMDLSTSVAEVTYVSIQKDTIHNSDPIISIDIRIRDMIGMPYITKAFQTQQDYENVTGDSSQKTVTVAKKYKGLEEINKSENKSCKISFAIVNHYIVTLEASGTDSIQILYDIIDSMNLDKLEKFAATN